MTEPFHVDTDGLDGWSADTRGRVPDFRYQPVDSDGDWPSHRSMQRFQGRVQADGDSLGSELDGHADHGTASSAQYRNQEASSADVVKAIPGIMSGLAKDGESALADLGKTVATTGTTVITAATQAATTGMNGILTAVTASTKAGAPGGTPVGLQPAQGQPPDSPTTHGKDYDGRDRAPHADANS